LNFSKEIPKNLNRSSEIDKTLYQDALQRIEKNKTRKFARNLSLDLQETRTNMLKEKSQEKTEVSRFNKITKEVFKIVEIIKINTEKNLNYLQCLEILNRMGFLKYHNINFDANMIKTSRCFLEERTLIVKMWKFLQSYEQMDDEETVPLRFFIRFLAGILGITAVFKENVFEEKRENENGCITFNRFDENHQRKEKSFNYKKIHKEFEVFYRNRLGFLKKEKVFSMKIEKKLKLSKNSENLAMKHYEKILNPNESIDKVAFHERFARGEALVQAKIIQKSVENTQKILESCTFKPMVKLRSCSNPKIEKTTRENTVKPKILTSTLKKTEDLEYEKQKNECTFKPNLTKTLQKSIKANEKFLFQQKKNIERIEQARIERGFQRNFKERGIPLKKDVLKEIGNLSFSEINPELMKKYFGSYEKKNNLSTIYSLNKMNKSQSSIPEKYSSNCQTLKSN